MDDTAQNDEHEEDGEERVDLSSEFYALLNVPKDASTETIREKYRQLAILLHPDKQTDNVLKETANDRFQRVKKAYEVLSDPNKRAVYDALGEEGLKHAGEVGQRFQTSAEILAEIERLARRNSAGRNSIPGRGVVSCVVDARSLVIPAKDFSPGITKLSLIDRLDGISVSGFSVKHTLQTLPNPSTKLTLSSGIGRGGRGSLVGTVRHQFSSRFYCETDIGLLDPRFATIRSSYEPDPYTELSLVSNITPRQFFIPSFVVGVSRVLHPHVVGVISYTSGWPPHSALDITGTVPWSPSAFNVGIKSTQWSAGLELNGGGSITLSSDRKVKVTPSTTVSVGGAIGIPGGIAVTASAAQNLQDIVTGGLSITFSVIWSLGGVVLRIKVVRDAQVLIVPIKLTDESNLEVALWTTLIPTVGITALEYFALGRARRSKSRVAELRTRHREELARRRKEAEEEVELLREQVSKRVETEKAKQGLVILEAKYAVRRDVSADAAGTDEVDVTIPVQALVSQSQLSISGGRSKAQLLGFYDPCYGYRKTLRVRYTFKGREHAAEIDDLAPLVAPLRGHLVS